MKKLLDRYFRVEHFWGADYTGRGHAQGIGFNLLVRRFTIGNPAWFTVVTDIVLSTESEWLENLKGRLKK
jgi:hypothetical protein